VKRYWKAAAIATLVTVLAVGAVATVALAQEGSDDGSGWNLREKMHEAIARILGITVEEYDTAVEAAQEQVLGEAVADDWLTQEQADRMQERMSLDAGGRRMVGKGFVGGRFAWGIHGVSLISVAADELGMSLSDLTAEFQEGKSIAEVAEEKGLDPQAIVDACLAQYEEKLAEAVEEERIAQKQADLMLENTEKAVVEQLDAACGGCSGFGFKGRGGRGRGGWFGGFRGMGGF